MHIACDPILQTLSTPLHLAAYDGHLKVATALLEAQAPLLAKNKFGDTVFHIAIRHGRTGFLMKLLEFTFEQWEMI